MLRCLTSAAALLALTGLGACDAPQAVGAPTSSGISSFVGGGNSSAAHLCYQGGWQHLATADGTPFTSVGDCVSYAAHGGTPGPLLPVITSFVFDGLANHCVPIDGNGGGSINAVFTAIFSGGTGTITNPAGAVFPVVSGVATEAGPIGSGNYVLTVTNGGGSVTSSLNPLGDSGGTPGCPAGP